MEAQAATPIRADADVLVLDAGTFRDLEIFRPQTGGSSLFQFRNLSRTEGGAKALRRRMERPWSNAARIRATQQSVSFILAQRQAFTKMPSAYVTRRVDRYAHEILPIITQTNWLSFGVAALSASSNRDSHYRGIVAGVQFSCALIRALKEFTEQPELASAAGEVAGLIEEMDELLRRPSLSPVPDDDIGGWPWRIMRLDQLFRLHEREAMMRVLQLVYEIDALVAMADATQKYQFVLPVVEEGSLRVHAEGLVHPFVAQAVANPVELDQARRVLFLTGPNMAGKTTYLRAFAIALYLAHLGMGVPAGSFRFVPAQKLFTAISMNDDLHGGVSYFRAEALRVRTIAEAIAKGDRAVALMDEPFKGTNVKDAFDASLAILERLAARQDCLFVFCSHLIELSEHFSRIDRIDCRYFRAEEDSGRLQFDYRLHSGVSNQRLGMRVLREEGVFELLDEGIVPDCRFQNPEDW